MEALRISSDPISHTVEFGQRIPSAPCMDESELREQNVLDGIRRAEGGRGYSALGIVDDDRLPSENYFG